MYVARLFLIFSLISNSTIVYASCDDLLNKGHTLFSSATATYESALKDIDEIYILQDIFLAGREKPEDLKNLCTKYSATEEKLFKASDELMESILKFSYATGACHSSSTSVIKRYGELASSKRGMVNDSFLEIATIAETYCR